MKSPLFLAALLAVTIFHVEARAERPTNYEVVSRQIDSLVNAVSSILKSDSINALECRMGSRDLDEFVHQKFFEGLIGKGFKLFSDSSSLASMTLSVPLMEISYSEPVTAHVFGASELTRTIQSEYAVEITREKSVKFADSFRYTFKDTVSESEITGLESGSYSFLRGKFDDSGFIDTILQPVLFIAAAGVIVYLFFSLRGS